MIFIDTVELSGNTVGDEDTNPNYYDPLPYKSKLSAMEQWTWIETQLSESTADYLFVAGHFPIYSVCEHGNTQNLIDNLEPLLLKYKASGYLAGHDHCMSTVKDIKTDLYYIVTGNANFCCTKPSHINDIPSDKNLQWYIAGKEIDTRGGFSTITITDKTNGLYVNFYDQNGKFLHKTDSIKSRF